MRGLRLIDIVSPLANHMTSSSSLALPPNQRTSFLLYRRAAQSAMNALVFKLAIKECECVCVCGRGRRLRGNFTGYKPNWIWD